MNTEIEQHDRLFSVLQARFELNDYCHEIHLRKFLSKHGFIEINHVDNTMKCLRSFSIAHHGEVVLKLTLNEKYTAWVIQESITRHRNRKYNNK